MNILNKRRENRTVGNNATEIYVAKANKFWLSPAYGHNVIRIDLLYFLGNISTSPVEFFEQCYELLKNVRYRCHWGKYIPKNYENKIADLYPKYEEWKKVRNEMDPNKVKI